jgi:6-pyruvoyl-tetrahydropterin synthase
MTRLASAFNLNGALRTKTFELGGHTFKVKVPLTSELDEIFARIIQVDDKIVKERLKKMTDALTKEPIEGVEITKDDVIVNGASTKETVISVLQMERKITEYIKLLVPESGNLAELTYEEIEQEFPLQIQLELIEKITESIQPGYKDARKN